jgi:hypothetical protein
MAITIGHARIFQACILSLLFPQNLFGISELMGKENRIFRKFNVAATSRFRSRAIDVPALEFKQLWLKHCKNPWQSTVGFSPAKWSRICNFLEFG